jgi:hypothetical protein
MEDHIFRPMQSIFNTPMTSHHVVTEFRGGGDGAEIVDAMNGAVVCRASPPFNAEDGFRPRPLLTMDALSGIHPDQPLFLTPMVALERGVTRFGGVGDSERWSQADDTASPGSLSPPPHSHCHPQP